MVTAARGRRLGPHGRHVVAAAFLTQGISTGATVYVYGVFLKPLTAEFAASRMSGALGLSAMYAIHAVLSPALGRALDRHSIRAIMIGGALLLSVGLVLLAATTALWQVGLVFALVIGCGSLMAGPLSASTLVANWFVTGRGRALGLAALGTSVCGFVLPPVASWLIQSVGWRNACAALGLTVAVLLVPLVSIWVVSRPEERGLGPDGVPGGSVGPEPPRAVRSRAPARPLLLDRSFWAIASSTALLAGAVVALLTHLVAFATDLGIEAKRASLLVSVLAGFGMLGKLFFGGLVDRIDKRGAFWLMVGVQALGWLILLQEPDYTALLLAAAILGLGAGGGLPISGALVGSTFGRADFGRVMGAMSPVMLTLTLLAPPIAGHLYDLAHSYQLAFRILLGGSILAAVPIAFLRIPDVEPSATTA